MEELKDYIFYTITKDFGFSKKEKAEFAFGIKRGGNCKEHGPYFEAFLNKSESLFEGIDIRTYDWSYSVSNIAADGSVMIVNTAIEHEEIEKRLYMICLPSFPTFFQLEKLEEALKEFETVKISVSVHGEAEAKFWELHGKKDFNDLAFLKSYIVCHKQLLKEISIELEEEKVMQ